MARKKEKPGQDPGWGKRIGIEGIVSQRVVELEFSHIYGLRTFGAFFNLETHSFLLVERFETATFDGTEMNKHIGAAFRFDEAIALFAVKPFHSTFRHPTNPFLNATVGLYAGSAILRSLKPVLTRGPIISANMKTPNLPSHSTYLYHY